jgi:hypothetical protein
MNVSRRKVSGPDRAVRLSATRSARGVEAIHAGELQAGARSWPGPAAVDAALVGVVDSLEAREK